MKRLFFCFFLMLVIPIADAKDTNKALETLSKFAPLLISNDQIGLWFSRGLEREYGLLNNEPQISNRLQQVGSKILGVIPEPNAKYDFATLNGDDFNAVSIFGGHIRVFKGLLYDTRNSDDELAAVVAHEIAHQEKGHNKSAVKTFKIATLLGATNLDEKMPEILKLGAAAALAKRSRKHEKEADENALRWMTKAGYNPRGAIAVFRRIEAENKLAQKRSNGSALSNRFARIFATHPEPAKRAEAAEDYLFRKKYGSTFKMVLGTKAVPLSDGFDWPVGSIINHEDSQGVPLKRQELTEGGWVIGTNTDSNNDGIIDGGFLDSSYTGKPHAGVDLNWRSGSDDLGQTVYAIANGKVIDILPPEKKPSWRGIVGILHELPNGQQFVSQYAHLGYLEQEIQKDAVVTRGQKLGTIGPTPQGSTSPHLHFEMRDNIDKPISQNPYTFETEGWIDPIKFIQEHRQLTMPTIPANKVLIRQGPVHLGDDVKGSQIEDDAVFDYAPQDATLKLRVKGTPNKDPIIWINRVEVGRIVTSDDKWHWYEFPVNAKLLREGKNLFHIESYIPDRWQTFDDCEFADVYILKK